MTKEQLIKQLKDNCEKAKKYRITHDQGIKFERLYDCFENIGELETKKTEGLMIKSLKGNQNEVKAVFHRMLNNNDFCDTLKTLKNYSPIINNTREAKKVIISDEKDFDTIIEVIYTTRNNLRHGKEEYIQKNEARLRVINHIFEKIVFGARLKYLS